MNTGKIKFVSSVLFVRDLEVTRKFYEGLLGQKVLMTTDPNVGFEGGLAIWQRDYAWKTLFGHQRPLETEHNNLELYFETEDLEEAVQALTQAGVRLLHPIQEQPWAQRVARFYDPDGYVIDLGEPIPAVVTRLFKQGLRVEEIAKRTAMPEEIVGQIVEQLEATVA